MSCFVDLRQGTGTEPSPRSGDICWITQEHRRQCFQGSQFVVCSCCTWLNYGFQRNTNVRGTYGNNTTLLQVKGREGLSTNYKSFHKCSNYFFLNSHPFTGWTSLVAMSKCSYITQLPMLITLFSSPGWKVLRYYILVNHASIMYHFQFHDHHKSSCIIYTINRRLQQQEKMIYRHDRAKKRQSD